MDCLHCGDCCKRMSPLSAPEPCPNIIEDGDFCFCVNYNTRPEQCKNHKFPMRFCPIGLSILKLEYPRDTEKIRNRLETGYMKTKKM